jgi:hypothetical protein
MRSGRTIKSLGEARVVVRAPMVRHLGSLGHLPVYAGPPMPAMPVTGLYIQRVVDEKPRASFRRLYPSVLVSTQGM